MTFVLEQWRDRETGYKTSLWPRQTKQRRNWNWQLEKVELHWYLSASLGQDSEFLEIELPRNCEEVNGNSWAMSV